MDKAHQVRDLATFLAPMLAGTPGADTEPGSPDRCSHREKLIDRTEPDVDFAVYLELQNILKKSCALTRPDGAQNQTAGEPGERLRELLEGDDHAVGVLWALLAGCDDKPHPGVLQPAAARPSGGASPPSGLLRKTAAGLRRGWQAVRSSPHIQRNMANACMNALVALVLFLAWSLAWPPLQVRPQAGVLSLEVFTVWSLSFLPGWLYIRFLGQRAGALWDEYVLNLHRLAWDRPRHLPKPPVNSAFYAEWFTDGGVLLARRPNIYRQKFDAYYGKSVSHGSQREGPPVRIEALFPVFLTTVTLAVCWTAVLWSTHFASDPESVWDVLRFGFLGAYSFILQMLVRRFFQSDLRPAAYANAMLRLIVVLILVAALYQILPQGNYRAAAAIAFVVGFFPLVGMQAMQRFAATALRVFVPSLSPPYPLNQIDGLSVWYEARLLEEGIEDMQSLATANFVDVLLHTRVPVGRLVDWVDQAHLYLHLDRIEGTWRERMHAKSGKKPPSQASQSGVQPPTKLEGSATETNQADSKPHAGAALPRITEGSVTDASRADSKTRTALRQFGIRNATDLLNAFPPKRIDPERTLAPGSLWQTHLADVTAEGLDKAQLRTIVRVLDNEPSLAPVWNWQKRGVRMHTQPAQDFPVVPAQRAGSR